ncbi:hypothetical protein C8Q74DRAFT_1288064 [Fomes fomentarius]|nr:hypothetical protein C8Q74DRAFT_1288064 [Fomes fomentarius]
MRLGLLDLPVWLAGSPARTVLPFLSLLLRGTHRLPELTRCAPLMRWSCGLSYRSSDVCSEHPHPGAPSAVKCCPRHASCAVRP